jgi:tripartite motif-containing protein 71
MRLSAHHSAGVRWQTAAITLAMAAAGAAAFPTFANASSSPTATGVTIGSRITSNDGLTTAGSAAISAADGNFTSADIGFGITGGATLPTGETIVSVTSSTTATLSAPALKTSAKAIFSISFAGAGLYGWGAATEPDGSILMGDYWNFRIVHFNADGTPATPYVFAGNQGNGIGTNQAPFGICVDPVNGNVFMTEGSLYNVNEYSSTGAFITSWGSNQAVHLVKFTYPSQCAVDPTTHLLYISNQWGKSIVVIDPSNPSAPAQFESPPTPNTIIQPRGLAFDSAGNLWIADEGHKRIDVYYASSGLNMNVAPQYEIKAPACDPSAPACSSTTFDMRGLAIDKTTNLAFVANGQGCYVQEFDANPADIASKAYGKFLLNFNGVATGNSNCGEGNGQFADGARDIAVDGNDQVWVGDLADFRAQVFGESGNFLSAVPGTPTPPPTGGFNGPRGVAFDAAGNMYVTDMYNERVEAFAPNGSGGYTFAQTWGIRGDTANTFNYPRLDCVDPVTGYLIVADTDSSVIVAWDVTKTPPQEIWPLGGKSQGLSDPYGVACAPNGEIYVADSNDKDIAVFNSDGSVGSPAKIGSNLGFTRGIAVDPIDGSIWVSIGASNTIDHFASSGAALPSFSVGAGQDPFGIAVDAGYVYVALSSKNDVGQYTRAGVLQTTFGGAGSAIGQMRTPQGLAFAPDGFLYVVEENNARVSQWSVP